MQNLIKEYLESLSPMFWASTFTLKEIYSLVCNELKIKNNKENQKLIKQVLNEIGD